MILNATLSRVDTPGTPTAGGSVPYSTGAAVSVRGMMDTPSFSQRTAIGALVTEATAVLRLPKVGLPAGLVPARGQRFHVAVDGSSTADFKALYVRDWEKAGGLSHYEVYLKAE